MDKKKQQVILTAKELFKSMGFNTTSIQDIIDKSNISKGTFYNYFSSKNEFIMAYLDHARIEELNRRNKLLQYNDHTNKKVFVKQILVRMEIIAEFTLRPIYEGAIHSNDDELKSFIESKSVGELGWLAERITDIYGEDSFAYASDCAVMLHGMMSHMLYVGKILDQSLNKTLMLQYIIRRLDDIVGGLIGSNDLLLHDLLIEKPNPQKVDKVIERLAGLRKLMGEREIPRENIDFISKELLSNSPRMHVIQSCVQACLLNGETEEEKMIIETIQKELESMREANFE